MTLFDKLLLEIRDEFYLLVLIAFDLVDLKNGYLKECINVVSAVVLCFGQLFGESSSDL